MRGMENARNAKYGKPKYGNMLCTFNDRCRVSRVYTLSINPHHSPSFILTNFTRYRFCACRKQQTMYSAAYCIRCYGLPYKLFPHFPPLHFCVAFSMSRIFMFRIFSAPVLDTPNRRRTLYAIIQ